MKKNTKSDVLTRRSGDQPSEGDEWWQNISTLIKAHSILYLLPDTAPNQGWKPLETLWKQGITADSWLTQVLQM